MLAIDLNIGDVVLENGGDVDLLNRRVSGSWGADSAVIERVAVGGCDMVLSGRGSGRDRRRHEWGRAVERGIGERQQNGQGPILTSGKVPLEKTLRTG